MKLLCSLFLVFIVLFSLTSCFYAPEKESEQQYGNEYDNTYGEYVVNEIRNNNPTNNNSKNQKGIKYFESIDQTTGLVSTKYLFPSNWKESKQNGFLYEGPNNIRVSGSNSSNFHFTNNQQLAWTWQQQGIQNVPPMSLNQIIEQFLMPVAKETGLTLTKTYPLPDLTKTMILFHKQLFVSIPTQKDIKAYGLEWTGNNGMSYMSALIITVSYTQSSTGWGFQSQYLEAPDAYFNKSKKDFLFGLTNMVTNPQWVMVCNQRDAKRAGVQLKAHLGRMATINARVNTSKSVGDIYSEILDINHAGYLKRNDINSNGHSKTINMIGERTIIGNHDTGEHYNAPSGSKYYWVNPNGVAIGTNNSLFDPRIDNRINNTEWTQFQKEN